MNLPFLRSRSRGAAEKPAEADDLPGSDVLGNDEDQAQAAPEPAPRKPTSTDDDSWLDIDFTAYRKQKPVSPVATERPKAPEPSAAKIDTSAEEATLAAVVAALSFPLPSAAPVTEAASVAPQPSPAPVETVTATPVAVEPPPAAVAVSEPEIQPATPETAVAEAPAQVAVDAAPAEIVVEAVTVAEPVAASADPTDEPAQLPEVEPVSDTVPAEVAPALAETAVTEEPVPEPLPEPLPEAEITPAQVHLAPEPEAFAEDAPVADEADPTETQAIVESAVVEPAPVEPAPENVAPPQVALMADDAAAIPEEPVAAVPEPVAVFEAPQELPAVAEPVVEEAPASPAPDLHSAVAATLALSDLSEDDLRARIAAADAEVSVATAPAAKRRRGLGSLFRRKGASAPRPADPRPAAPRLPAARAFARAVYAPLPLVLIGTYFGGAVALLGLAAVLAFAVLSIPLAEAAREEAGTRDMLPLSGLSARALPYVYAATLAFTLYAVSVAGWPGPFGWLFTVLSLGVWAALWPVRQARQKARSRDIRIRTEADALFVTILMGHRGAAERLIIPRFAATGDDPHTAEPGESYWAFAARSFAGSFVASHAMTENLMKPRLGQKRTHLHPFLIHIAASAAFVFLSAIAFGVLAVPTLLGLAAVIWLSVAMDDYVARYGLLRTRSSDGKYEPLGTRHRWAFPDLLVWAGKARKGASLRSGPGPMMPRPLPLMVTLALVPRLWADEMDVRVMAMLKAARELQRMAVIPVRPVSAKSGADGQARLARRARV